MKKLIHSIIAVFLAINLQAQARIEPLLLYKAQQDSGCKAWVEKQMKRMTLKEKVGQLFIYTIAPLNNKKNLSLLRDAVHTYKVGGLLFSGGLLQNQATLTNYAQNLAEIPLMITFDGEWGLAMRLKDTPVFPKNMVLGCIRDDRLLYEYGREMARECREIGVQVNFAPVADVNINPNNPVINVRSFGEDPCNVADKVIAYASGLESGTVLSVAKHFPGHGDTDVDSHFSLPTLPFSRERLDSIELYPFKQAIRAGLSGIMVGHLQVPILEPDTQFPSSLSRNVVYGLLREELAFKGLIFTDALAMKGVSQNENVCAYALKAGNDLVLTPRNLKAEIESVLEEIKQGNISEESIEKKCRKVLTYKYALGLNRKPKIQISELSKRINTPETENLIRKLRIAAITITGNTNRILPLHAPEVAVVSIGKFSADTLFVNRIRHQASVRHFRLGEETTDSVQLATVAELTKYKRIIASVTADNLKPFSAFLHTLSAGFPTIYTFFTPFKTVEQVSRSLSKASAVVFAHSAEPEIQSHVAHALFGKAFVDGRLSVSIPHLAQVGEGITLSPQTAHYYAPEEYGMRSDILAQIDTIALEGIRQKAYPGCQIVILKNGKPIYDKAFGSFTYREEQKVTPDHLYDLASLSKTTGTLLALMKLYDKGMFSLNDKISQYLPFLSGTDKKDITIKELLFHESGLPPSLHAYKELIDKESYKGPFFQKKEDAGHPIRVGNQTYARTSFQYKKGWVSETTSQVYSLQVCDSFYLNWSFREQALQALAKLPVKGKKYVYSCVNFILLKELAEQLSGMGLDEYLKKNFYAPMGLRHIAYLPLRKFSKEETVPSVHQDYLRKGTLQGYVHDPAAAFFGGVSGNAGLFANARDVAAIHQLWLNQGEYNGKRYISKETCRLFTTETSRISRRGLGFDKPDTKNPKNNPCSESTPAAVYGHTGFTGTCAWADPENQLVYVFLSNRTYEEPWNNRLSKLNIRPRIQEVIYQSLF